MFKSLKDWLALTKTERRVILFLSTTFLAGIGIQLFLETFPSVGSFDYSASDSVFAALSSKPDTVSSADSTLGGLRVNLNTAAKSQLMSLPGIGEVTADRIISYRRENGSFLSVEDVKRVKGMNEKKFGQIKNLITVKD